jgi:hypothetical protein
MYQLTGDTHYAKVSKATGKLSAKLNELIATHGEDDRVYQLAGEFVEWWNLPFTDSKDAVGRDLWDKIESLAKILGSTHDSTISGSTTGKPNPTITNKIGRAIGSGIGIAAVTTVVAGTNTGRWLKRNGIPVVVELCKGIGSGTKESYLRSKKSTTEDTPADDDSPY